MQFESRELKVPVNLSTIDFSKHMPVVAKYGAAYLKALNLYLKQYETFQSDSETLLEHCEWEELRKLVHSLKGASGNLGMMSLFEMAGELEQNIKQRQMPRRQQLDWLNHLWKLSREDSHVIISANDKQASQPHREFAGVLDDIIALLQTNLVVQQDLIEELRESATTQVNCKNIDAAISALESFDYELALELLEQMNRST